VGTRSRRHFGRSARGWVRGLVQHLLLIPLVKQQIRLLLEDAGHIVDAFNARIVHQIPVPVRCPDIRHIVPAVGRVPVMHQHSEQGIGHRRTRLIRHILGEVQLLGEGDVCIDLAARVAASTDLKALEMETQHVGRLENGELLDGAAFLIAFTAEIFVVVVEDLGVGKMAKRGADRGAFDLERDIEDRVVSIGLVAAFTALDLRSEIAAPDLVHHGRLLDAHILHLLAFRVLLQCAVLQTLHHET